MANEQRSVSRQSYEPGVLRAWETLEKADHASVAREADVDFKNGIYHVSSFGLEYEFDPNAHEIRALGHEADELRRHLSYFFEITWLWYLVRARDFGLTGRSLKPEQLKGGHHFFKGAHELPLKALAERFGGDVDAFLARGRKLGGQELSFGDAAVRILPVPRVPVDLILWLGDDEFPARSDLLFDSSCELQLPLDIIWSAAMMSVNAMLA